MLPRRALAAAVAITVLAFGSCGEDDADLVTDEDPEATSTPEADTVSIRLVFDQPPSDADIDATTTIVEQRLDGLGVAGPTIERTGDDELVVRFPTSAGVDVADARGVLEESGQLTFRPVLQILPADVTPECQGPEGPLAPQLDDDGQVVQCYELGTDEMPGSIVLDASAELTGGTHWTVALDLRAGADGVDPFNAVTAECFDRAPSCPTGQLAIVLDGEVVSAPTIQQPTFDEQGVSITGDFTGSEAESLAVVLRSGALPIGLSVVDTEEPG